MALLDRVDRYLRMYLRMRGARVRWFTGSFGRMHLYDIPGTPGAPTLVLLHGIGAGATHFWPLMLRLRSDFGRILAPDHLGHGFSDDIANPSPEGVFAAMAEALDAELAEPAVIFGNSMGGAFAVQYALIRPEKVRTLLLCSPAGAPMSKDELVEFLKTFDLSSRQRAIDFVGRLYTRPPWFTRIIAPSVAKIFSRAWMRSFIATFRTEHFLSAEIMANLQVPTVLWWGREERIMPAASLAFWKTHLARVEEPEGFGHCPQLDHPRRLAAAIVAASRPGEK